MSNQLYPWFTKAWSEIQLDRMPHAIMIHGQPGIGKFDFALHLAKALLCENTSSAKPCCQCEACHWFDTGNHPDFLGVVPEDQSHLLPHEAIDGADNADEKPKKGKKKAEDDGDKADKKASSFIKVDQVRDALEGINTAPHRGIQRVVLINPVETLQAVSANTLLKTLEEPPESTLFILVSDRLDRVLPTIRSRCRLVALPRPQSDQAVSWLKGQLASQGMNAHESDIEEVLSQMGGAVMDALDHLSGAKEESANLSPMMLKALAEGAKVNWLGIAENTYKASMPEFLVIFERWIADLLSTQQSGHVRYYPTMKSELERCAKIANPNKLADFWKVLLDARRHELHALAQRVQMEALFIRYQDIFKA